MHDIGGRWEARGRGEGTPRAGAKEGAQHERVSHAQVLECRVRSLHTGGTRGWTCKAVKVDRGLGGRGIEYLVRGVWRACTVGRVPLPVLWSEEEQT